MKPDTVISALGLAVGFVGTLITAWFKINLRLNNLENAMPAELKERIKTIEHNIPIDARQRLSVVEERMRNFDLLEARLYAAIQKVEDTAHDLELAAIRSNK